MDTPPSLLPKGFQIFFILGLWFVFDAFTTKNIEPDVMAGQIVSGLALVAAGVLWRHLETPKPKGRKN